MELTDSRKILKDALIRVKKSSLKAPTKLTLLEWADTRRKLSRESSSEPGQWKTSRVPVAFGPMVAVNETDTSTITLMCSTQLMKTEFILNVIGWSMDENPVPMLFVVPKKELAESISKERIDPMLRDTPSLRGLVSSSTSRLNNTTMLHKPFPGGALNIVGSNSPTDLASRPVCIVVSDEIDKYPASSGKEGDALKLAEERTAKWWNRLHIRACSPTEEQTSRINREYLDSDMRRCYLKCPHCENHQHLKWSLIKWDKDKRGNHIPDTAQAMCGHCGAFWSEKERRKAIKDIEFASDRGYRQTAPFFCCDKEHLPDDVRKWDAQGRSQCPTCGNNSEYLGHAGFQVSKLYDTSVRLPDLVRKFLSAKKSNDINVLKTFINTQLAEVFSYETSRVDAETLMARRLNYVTGEILNSVKTLTVGADVQADRIECELIGWGADEESWSIDYQVFDGDPNSPVPWEKLDEYLLQSWRRNDGRYLTIQGACIDTGGTATQTVYKFCNARMGRRIWPIKGVALRTDGTRQPVWPITKGKKRTTDNINLVNVGVDAAKDIINANMRKNYDGAGAMHYPADRDRWFFDQITAERLVVGDHRGKKVLSWEKIPGRANEALDCRVYGYAALQGLIIQHKWNTHKDYSTAFNPVSDDKFEKGFDKSVNRVSKSQRSRKKAAQKKWLAGNDRWLDR